MNTKMSFTQQELAWFVQQTVYMLDYERLGQKDLAKAIKTQLNLFLDSKREE